MTTELDLKVPSPVENRAPGAGKSADQTTSAGMSSMPASPRARAEAKARAAATTQSASAKTTQSVSATADR